MTTIASADSASVEHRGPAFTGARLVHSFTRHETIKLGEGTFVQWKQLTGFLDGTVPPPLRFLQSLEGSLVPNLDASAFIQQDMLFISWLLSTINSSLPHLL